MIAIKKEKEKRLKRMGTSLRLLRTSQNQALMRKKKRKSSERSNFTGRKQLREEDLEDSDEMTPDEIRSLLVKQGLLKA